MTRLNVARPSPPSASHLRARPSRPTCATDDNRSEHERSLLRSARPGGRGIRRYRAQPERSKSVWGRARTSSFGDRDLRAGSGTLLARHSSGLVSTTPVDPPT